MKLAKASEMQQLDRAAIEKFNIPGMVLMENAGRGTYEFMVNELGSVSGKSAVIFVGPGNNGGDGLVIARYVHQDGGFPFIVYLLDPAKLKGDAALNHSIVKKLNLPHLIIEKEDAIKAAKENITDFIRNKQPWSVVDALFGTGLQRDIKGRFAEAVDIINTFKEKNGIPVTSVDIPSGLNADTGTVLGHCVNADLTATYGLAKPGHFIHGGRFTGKLHVIDIGIPSQVINNAALYGESLDENVLQHISARDKTSHKGNFGHLLLLAGSEGKTGAAILSAQGGLKVGTGLVSLAVPHRLNTIFETTLSEAMTIPLPQSENCLSADDIEFILKQVEGKSCVIIGPGLGTDKKTAVLVKELYRKIPIPIVVDADALNILAKNKNLIADPPAARVLTPHPGEMSRLTGLSTQEIQSDRLKAAAGFIKTANKKLKNVTLVLKGAGTIIHDPEQSWAINSTGNPGMAAGGMGDVLSGLIGGLLAQGIDPAHASRIGVYLHGLGADKLSKKRKFGYLASDVAEMIPFIMTELI